MLSGFVGKSNSIDYHDEMNGGHFEELIEHKLLPNLPTGTAIVMDNAPYHTGKRKKEPSWGPNFVNAEGRYSGLVV